MANDTTTRKQHDPDVKRDFETGTVNPGPGMAPPHWADDIPAGSMTGAEQTANKGKTDTKAGHKDGSGSCGCG